MAPPEVCDRDVPAEQVVTGQEENYPSRFTTEEEVQEEQNFVSFFRAKCTQLAEPPPGEAEKLINPQLSIQKSVSGFNYRCLPGQISGMWQHLKLHLSARIDHETETDMNRYSTNIICKEIVDTKEEQSGDIHAEEICVNSSDSPAQNDSVKDTIPETNVGGGDSSCKSALQVKESVLPLKCAGVIQEEGTDSAKIRPLTMKGPAHNLKVFPEVGGKIADDRPQQAKCELPAKVASNTAANNSCFVIDQLCTPGLELIICGNYREENKWKAGVTYFSVEKLMNELSQIASYNKLTFGGYNKEPPPSAPLPFDVLATSNNLHRKYEDSLLKNETTAHNDQRSNRDCKKAEKGAPSCGLNAPSSGPAICPDESRSIPRKHQTENQSVRHQSGSKQQHPIEKRQLIQQSSHHSSKPISGEPSDSTQSPSSSWSKNGGNESNYSSTQRKKRGGASNQGGGTLGRGSGTGEENGDGLSPDDHSKKNQDVAPQANKKKEPPIPLKQEQHLLQVWPSSISSETPPEAVRMKVSNQQICSKPTPTSPVMPETEVQSQNPSAVICDDAGGQPRLKPPINTQASPGAEDFSQNPPIAIRNRVATEPRSYFNVKPPPDSQGAEVSSEWDEPTTKTSASASILALRDPTVELNDESPPSDSQLPCTKVGPNKISEDLTSNVAVQMEESEAQVVGLPSPALPTCGQHFIMFNDHNLLSFQESESNTEFHPFPFTPLTGDDSSLPPQPSNGNSQMEATLDSVGNTHDFYQHPVEEAGNQEPGHTEMVISSLTLPADHMYVYHVATQEGAINGAPTHTTFSSHVVSSLVDIWAFIALVDVYDNNNRSC